MSTDAVEKFRARAKALRETGGVKLSDAAIERHVQKVAETAERERQEKKFQPPKEPIKQEGRVTVVDKYGNRSHFKEGERIE